MHFAVPIGSDHITFILLRKAENAVIPGQQQVNFRRIQRRPDSEMAVPEKALTVVWFVKVVAFQKAI